MKKYKKTTPVLSADISRRDFVNGVLIGSGAALLGAAGCTAETELETTAAVPAAAPSAPDYDPWNGYAGVGDYAKSNGNVASTRDAAHLVRDGLTDAMMGEVEDTGEEYDLVIVGGGFSGAGAAYQFHKEAGEGKRCLIIENHPVFGGEAKQNEFEVDGYTVYGAQGSNDFVPPAEDGDDLIVQIYRDTGLPFDYEFVPRRSEGTNLRVPLDHFFGIYWEEESYDTGYFFGKDAETPWVVNPREDKLARTPWSDEFKAELNKAFADREDYYEGEDIDQWLDSMSYKELLEDVMGFSSDTTEFLDPILAISMGGVGSDVYSAYSAKLLDMPGCGVHYTYSEDDESAYMFPGGNTGIYRHIMKYLVPDSITGGSSLEDILYNPINFDALDADDNRVNLRLNATAIDVAHAGSADDASHVNVAYYKDDKVSRVKAKSVVMATGGWVSRRIVKDLPTPMVEAYKQFHHSPILVVNVALRNWRFLERLGIAQGRWFEGFGNFFGIRRPMITGEKTEAFHPDKPTVMTFYVPFLNQGTPAEAHGVFGRAELLSKSYADFEAEIVGQMNDMFADAGFDAENDIAGIVLNRWGHAYISPAPGFHFGRDGNKSPIETVKEGYGRIRFGHSELSGYMSNSRAMTEGARAASEALATT